jgi:acetyl-CoA carboxylase alpha subunit
MSKLTREEREEKRKIKEMEDKARAEAMAAADEVVMIQPEGEDQSLMSYDQWWMLAQARKPLRPHMKEIIWADMRARGCSKKETQAKYDEAMRLFGYSW